MAPRGDESPATKFLRRFCGLAIDEDQAGVDEFLHSRAREFRAVGSHEPVQPRSSVSINRQKFMHLGLGSTRPGQIVAGAIRTRGGRAPLRSPSKPPRPTTLTRSPPIPLPPPLHIFPLQEPA